MNKILRIIIIGFIIVTCFSHHNVIAQTQTTKTNHTEKGIDNFIQKLGYKFVDSYKLKMGEFKGTTTTIYKDVDDLTRIEKITDSENKVLRVTLMLPNACIISKYDSLMDEKMGKEIYDVIKIQGATRLAIFLDYVMEGQEGTTIAKFITNVVEEARGTIQKKQFGNYDVSILASSISPLVTVSVEKFKMHQQTNINQSKEGPYVRELDKNLDDKLNGYDWVKFDHIEKSNYVKKIFGTGMAPNGFETKEQFYIGAFDAFYFSPEAKRDPDYFLQNTLYDMGNFFITVSNRK